MPVNIHALRWLAGHAGGDSLAAEDADDKFTVFALLQFPGSARYGHTRAAFAEHIQEVRPADFCAVSRVVRKAADQMAIEDILAYVRLSRYDSHQFQFFLPRLIDLATGMTDDEKSAVLETVEKVWAAYFPLGEEFDLAYHIGCMLYEVDCYAEALRYFCCSQNLYGAYTGTLFNIASCHWMMGSAEQATVLLERVLEVDQENAEARKLLEETRASSCAGQNI
jgi:tetratricopeptide (TPR) repeat protein